MYLRKSFEHFLSNKVNLDATRMERVKRAHRSVRSELKAIDEVSAILTGMYLQGSYALLTACRPCGAHTEYDVDIVLAGDFRGEDRRLMNGLQVLHWLQSKIESIGLYTGKTKILEHCVRIKYESDGQRFHLDVVPAHRPNHTDGPIHIAPDWTLSDPKGYSKWFEKRRRKSQRLRHIVRLLKYWRNLQGNSPNSMILTTLAAWHCPADYRSLDHALVQTMTSMNQWLQDQSPTAIDVRNPSQEEENLARNWHAGDVASFQSRFQAATQMAEEALACKDEERTIDIWNTSELFDGHFPKAIYGLGDKAKAHASAMSSKRAFVDPNGKVKLSPGKNSAAAKASGGFFGDR